MASKIAVIGTGYVGLTTGACLAHLGHDVVCADIDEAKVEALNNGEIPILEDGLDNLVIEGRRAGRLRFVVGAANAVGDREFVYLCVPTPQGDDGSADLSYIESAAREIGPELAPEAIVINKSTVPVGSTRVVEQALQRGDVSVVSNPEFLREGSAVHDFLNPDRVVIGAVDQAAAIRMAGLYIGLTAPIMVTDPASAETIKYASNAFLATKISFVNAVAAVCEAVGADVNDVVLGMGYDRRIGQEFLKPGPGWGGSCFPKDTVALIHIAEEAGYDFRLLKGVVDVNNEQFERVYRVQMNTLELLVAFLPALYAATRYWPGWAIACVGAVYLVGRVIYWRAYISAPASRGLGFALSIGPVFVLALAVLVPAVLGKSAA